MTYFLISTFYDLGSTPYDLGYRYWLTSDSFYKNTTYYLKDYSD